MYKMLLASAPVGSCIASVGVGRSYLLSSLVLSFVGNYRASLLFPPRIASLCEVWLTVKKPCAWAHRETPSVCRALCQILWEGGEE